MMTPSSPSPQRSLATGGFTLVELLVSMAIVGILAAIAYPAYSQYLIRGHRAAAESHLLDLAQAQTQYLADARAYATTVAQLNTPTPANVAAKYTVTIDVLPGPPSTFTITATPVAGTPQEADGALTINSAGAKTPSDKW